MPGGRKNLNLRPAIERLALFCGIGRDGTACPISLGLHPLGGNALPDQGIHDGAASALTQTLVVGRTALIVRMAGYFNPQSRICLKPVRHPVDFHHGLGKQDRFIEGKKQIV